MTTVVKMSADFSPHRVAIRFPPWYVCLHDNVELANGEDILLNSCRPHRAHPLRKIAMTLCVLDTKGFG